MSSGFQQQASDHNLNFSKSAPTPQHGRKSDREVVKRVEETRAPHPGPAKH